MRPSGIPDILAPLVFMTVSYVISTHIFTEQRQQPFLFQFFIDFFFHYRNIAAIVFIALRLVFGVQCTNIFALQARQ